MASNYIGRDSLLQPARRRYVDVEIDGLGKVRLQDMNAREHSWYQAQFLDSDGRPDITRASQVYKGLLIALCVVDEHGERMYDESDVDKILAGSAVVVDELADACMAHCGLDGSGDVKKN